MHLERSICYIECTIDPKFVGKFGVNGLDVVAAASVDAHRHRLLPRYSPSELFAQREGGASALTNRLRWLIILYSIRSDSVNRIRQPVVGDGKVP